MRKWIQFALSVAITVVGLVWTFKDTQWEEMWTSLRTAEWTVLLWYLPLLTLIHVARTLRWGALLAGLERIPFRKLNDASAIGFMMLLILPFRLGEFARPFLIAQRSSVRRSAAMTSVVLERVVDGVIIAILLRVLMFYVPPDLPSVGPIRIGANVMFLVFGSGLVFLLLARWQHERVIGLMRATLGRVAPGITDKVIYIVDGFVSALRQLPGRTDMALFFFWTAVYWVANGYGMSMFANAFDCSGGTAANCSPLTLSVFEGYVVLCVLIVGIMIPAAPGSAGTFQAFIILALTLFESPGTVKSSGVAFANVLWLVQMSQQILFGLMFMVLSNASFSDIAGRLSADSSAQQKAGP